MALLIKEDGAAEGVNVTELQIKFVKWGKTNRGVQMDDGKSIDINNLSVREIVPPSQ